MKAYYVSLGISVDTKGFFFTLILILVDVATYITMHQFVIIIIEEC